MEKNVPSEKELEKINAALPSGWYAKYDDRGEWGGALDVWRVIDSRHHQWIAQVTDWDGGRYELSTQRLAADGKNTDLAVFGYFRSRLAAVKNLVRRGTDRKPIAIHH